MKIASVVVFTSLLSVAGCSGLTVAPASVVPPISPAQVQTAQVDVAAVTSEITSVCGTVNAVAQGAALFAAVPAVGALESFATASCGGAAAIGALAQKAVNDPTTIAWAEDLAGKITSAVAAVKAL